MENHDLKPYYLALALFGAILAVLVYIDISYEQQMAVYESKMAADEARYYRLKSDQTFKKYQELKALQEQARQKRQASNS